MTRPERPIARSARPNATLKTPKEAHMPDIEDVLEDAQREIKSIGDNVKSLKDNMKKNLEDVRKIAEDAPKAFAASEQFKKDMEALTAGVLEKHDAIALKVRRGWRFRPVPPRVLASIAPFRRAALVVA